MTGATGKIMENRRVGASPRPQLSGVRRGDALAPRISVSYSILLLTVPGIVVVDSGIGFLQGDPGGSTPGLSLGQVMRGGLLAAGLLSLVLLGRRLVAGERLTCAALLGLVLAASISGVALQPEAIE